MSPEGLDGLGKVMKRKVFSKEEEGGPPEHNATGLDNKILRKNKQGALTSDFDKDLMKLVAEVKCWEKLQGLRKGYPFGCA